MGFLAHFFVGVDRTRQIADLIEPTLNEMGFELVRVLVRRSTATYYVKSTGHLPPGMKPLKTTEPTLEESAQTVKKAGRKLSRRSRGR